MREKNGIGTPTSDQAVPLHAPRDSYPAAAQE